MYVPECIQHNLHTVVKELCSVCVYERTCIDGILTSVHSLSPPEHWWLHVLNPLVPPSGGRLVAT